MHLTVEQALSVYPLSEGKLIAGSAGSNRVVKSINVMDAPDIADWIKEGEMLFTTAYCFRDRPGEALDLIRKLNKRRASGLGIKLGRFWEEVPHEIVALAEELEFPLIELPYPFTFSDQMNGLFQAEIKRATVQMQDVLEKQVRLMRFALQSAPARAFFEAVAEVVGVPMAVVGSRGQIVYNAAGLTDAVLLQGWPWSARKKPVKYEESQALRVPLLKQEQCTGYVIFLHGQPFLSPLEEGLYVQTAELICFHLNINYEDFFEISARKDFGLLLRRHLKNGLPLEALDDYASRWGMDVLNKPYRCVLTDLTAEGAAKTKAEKLERLKSDFLGHARLQELDGLHIVLEEGVLSVVADDPAEGEGRVEEAFLNCLTGSRSYQNSGPKSALSSRKLGSVQLMEAFEECLDTQRLSKEWGIGERVVTFGMLDLALVFERVPRERMQAYCNRWLGGLLQEKPDYAQEMLRTLETFLECDGQLNETAKKMYIHRNTVTYRIEKLSEILDVDFKKVSDLLRLKLAFLFRRMLLSGAEGAERAV